MKLRISSSVLASTLLSLASRSDGAAFVGTDGRGVGYARPTTSLRFTEWEDAGTDSSSSTRPVDPSKSIQSYLTAPEPAVSKSNLDGTVLVSGFANDRDRPDQRIFDLLNDEEGSSFSFDRIVAFVDDVKFAKKRLISRTARYSGLLNKLDFEEGVGVLPTVEQLAGVKHWVAHAGSDLSLVSQIGELVKMAPDVENVSVLLTGVAGEDAYQSEEAVKALSDAGKTFTVVALGDETDDVAEGTHPYAVAEFGTKVGKLPEGSTFSRDEGLRLVAECLGLECASNRALAFAEVRDVNATETKLIVGLREAGYEWSQELEHMIDGGIEKYDAACKDYEKEHVTDGEADWMARADEKLKKAMKEEEEAQKRREAEWLEKREVAMEAERIQVEEGHAEWA